MQSQPAGEERILLGPPAYRDLEGITDKPLVISDPPQATDFPIIFRVAQKRWLKAEEVHLVLKYARRCGYQPCSTYPECPSSGSLFLFDRKTLPRFRRDGINWVKKEGKSLLEHHEKLKVNGRYAINCSYSKSEDRPSFHRRIYRLLNGEEDTIFGEFESFEVFFFLNLISFQYTISTQPQKMPIPPKDRYYFEICFLQIVISLNSFVFPFIFFPFSVQEMPTMSSSLSS